MPAGMCAECTVRFAPIAWFIGMLIPVRFPPTFTLRARPTARGLSWEMRSMMSRPPSSRAWMPTSTPNAEMFCVVPVGSFSPYWLFSM